MEMTLSPSSSLMPRTPVESRPLNTRTSFTGKRMHWPCAVVSVHVVRFGADLDACDLVALVQLHGDLAGPVDAFEVGQLVAPDIARAGCEHQLQRTPGGFILRHRHDGGDALVLLPAAAG